MKHLVRLVIGSVVYGCWRVFRPQRLNAVREQLFASHALPFLERQVLAFALLVTPMDTRTASSYWAGHAGDRFHCDPDHRLTLDLVAADSFYRRPMLDTFASRAAEVLRPGGTIVEVGCGAGGNLLYLRSRLAGQHFRFRGFDINAEVIASNSHHNCDELTFEVRDCFASAITVPGDLGLIFAAVLMYVREHDMQRLLCELLGNLHARILIGISEPTDDPDATASRPHNNLALLHGYRRIFREAGFRLLSETVRQEEGKQTRIYHAVFDLPR